MILGAIYRKENDELLIPKVWKTTGALERMRGLIARKPLETGEGLLISPCGAVHTFGMKYALDLAFIGKDGMVKKLTHGLAPCRFSYSAGAIMTLELLAGSFKKLGLAGPVRLYWGEGEPCAR